MATATKKDDSAINVLFEKEDLGLEEMLELRRKLYGTHKLFRKFESVLYEFDPVKSKKLSSTAKATARKGIALWIANKHDEAIKTLESAHTSKETDYFLGLAYMDVGQHNKAAELMNKLYKDMPDSRAVFLPYVDLKIKLGEAAKALEHLQKARKDARNDADIHYYLGLCLELLGQYTEADKEYQNALRIDKSHSPTLFRMAYNADLNGDEETALKLYEQIKENSPAYNNVLMNLGVLYEDKGNYAKAQGCYQKALAGNPNNARARLYLGDVEAAGDMFYDEELKRKELSLRQLLNQPLTDFRLSIRSRKLMNALDVRGLGDLVKKTEADLLNIPNFGQKSLNEIKELLARRGLALAIPNEPFNLEKLAREQVLSTPQKTESILNKSVFEIDWSARVRSALDKLKIYTLGELVHKTEYDFLGVRNFGATSLEEIKARLKQMGLKLSVPE